MFGYVLAIIGLLSLAAMTLSISGRPDPGRLSEQAVAGPLVTQAQAVAAEINACALMYPDGDNGTPWRKPYPAAPAPVSLETLVCPGMPAPNNMLYGLGSTQTAPPAIRGLGGWQYANDGTSLRLSITSTDASHATALSLAATRLGPAASVSGNTLTFTLRH